MSVAPTYRAFTLENHGRPRDVLIEAQLPLIPPTGRDIRVRVFAGAVNPVDIKVIHNFSHSTEKAASRIVPGWDAAGIVDAVGEGVTAFKVGDEVSFAGLRTRQGSFGEYVLVDERIVGKKPKTLSWEQAAAFPLTTITAWEGLVEELGISIPTTAEEEKKNASKSLLVLAGAGGVGSQVIQIAKNVLKIGTVIATASRSESVAFCKSLGADNTISHKDPLLPQLKALGLEGTNYVFNCVGSEYHDQVTAVTLPFGAIVTITGEAKGPVAFNPNGIFAKRISQHFEMMFARALYNIEPERQGVILNTAADLLDRGILKSTLTKTVPFSREGLVEALELQESGAVIGKIAFTSRKV